MDYRFVKKILKNGERIMNRKRIGNLGEVATIKKFVERGIPVYTPVGDTETADLIAEFGGKLQKIQVKSSTQIAESDATIFSLTTTKLSFNNGKINSKNIHYSSTDIDYFALYDYYDDDVYLLKNKYQNSTFSLSSKNPKNNQSLKIHNKDEYLFDNVIQKEMTKCEKEKMNENFPSAIDVEYSIID